MFQRSLLALVMAGFASIALPAQAQTEAGSQEVTVQAVGSFVTTTTHNAIDNTATNSGGVLGSYRFFFSRQNGTNGGRNWS